LNTDAPLQTFPYPTASKSFLQSNTFMAKSGAQTPTFKSVTNKQTSTQKLNVFGRPGGRRHPSPTKLHTVTEDLEHVLAPQKRLGTTHSFATTECGKFGGNPTPST